MSDVWLLALGLVLLGVASLIHGTTIYRLRVRIERLERDLGHVEDSHRRLARRSQEQGTLT